jgi:hypothetical protein
VFCGWADGWARERARGEHSFMTLLKFKKRGKNYAVFYFAGKRIFYINIIIYEVFTLEK